MEMYHLLVFVLALLPQSLASILKDNESPSKGRYVGISIVGGNEPVKGERYPPQIGGDRYPIIVDRERYPDKDYRPNGDRDRYPGNRPPGGDRDRFPGGRPGSSDRDRYPGGYPGTSDRDRYPVHPGAGGDRDRYPQQELDYVTFYEKPYFRGWSFDANLSRQCRNLENDYGRYNNGISSVKTHGNCLVVFTRFDCRGREYVIRPRYGHGPEEDRYRPPPIGHSELAEDLNNSISSYRRC